MTLQTRSPSFLPRKVPTGSTNPRFPGLSFLQLKIPKELHFLLREELLRKRTTVNAVADDIVHVYLDYLRSGNWTPPENAKKKKVRRLKNKGTINGDQPESQSIPIPVSELNVTRTPSVTSEPRTSSIPAAKSDEIEDLMEVGV